MAVPDYQTLMRPLLEEAAAAPGDLSVIEVVPKIAERFALTQKDLAQTVPSGSQSLLYNRIAWAKTYLVKAGLLNIPSRGRFRITPAGRDFLQARQGPIKTAHLKAIPEFQEWKGASASQSAADEGHAAESAALSPDDMISQGLARIEEGLVQEILDRLKGAHPKRFEAIVIDLLKSMGYGVDEDSFLQTPYVGDDGIDGIIREDKLGLDLIYIQAKRYTEGSVGQPSVQQFVGSMEGHNASRGVFVTTATFSEKARNFVRTINKRVILIDGPRLARLCLDHGVGTRTTRTITLRAIDPEYFEGG
ncbi:MAG: restriction endonuclease [Sphingomonadaceae bacterium]|uniref:restriction endonuclease n=1 Tax=Thermaurantiacus sp. TaxID=2820283 RepID=UPI00298EF802|nr:restriction endonuclease [Thermaurantiacus sp.]MCS6987675.1 restriction endonuclease [Sphingomonadaceae bacterium]MDW8415276.1 restriction endonuclease [Thermaurantiacus sp.]